MVDVKILDDAACMESLLFSTRFDVVRVVIALQDAGDVETAKAKVWMVAALGEQNKIAFA
jgi:hypothetical protein